MPDGSPEGRWIGRKIGPGHDRSKNRVAWSCPGDDPAVAMPLRTPAQLQPQNSQEHCYSLLTSLLSLFLN